MILGKRGSPCFSILLNDDLLFSFETARKCDLRRFNTAFQETEVPVEVRDSRNLLRKFLPELNPQRISSARRRSIPALRKNTSRTPTHFTPQKSHKDSFSTFEPSETLMDVASACVMRSRPIGRRSAPAFRINAWASSLPRARRNCSFADLIGQPARTELELVLVSLSFSSRRLRK
jgi:hypothetical protein